MPDSPEVSVHNPTQEVQAQAARLEQMTADEVIREVRDAAKDERLRTRAEEVEVLALSSMSLDGDPDDPNSNRGKAREALSNAQKILLAIRQGKITVPQDLDSEAQEFVRDALSTMASSINPEVLDEKTGATVYSFFSKLIDGEVPNIDVLIRQAQTLGPLARISPRIFQNASNSIFEVAQNNGLSEEEVVQRVTPEQETIPEPQDQEPILDTDEKEAELDKATFEAYWHQASLGDFFDEADKQVVKAIFSPKEFFSHIEKIQDERVRKLIADGEIADKAAFEADTGLREKVGREVSEEFERDIVLKFSKLFLRVDTEKPTQFFEEIIQEGYYDSIQIVYNRLKRRLQLLAEELPYMDTPEGLTNIKFFKSHSEQQIGTKEVGVPERDGEGKIVMENGEIKMRTEKKTVAQYRIIPSPSHKPVSNRDYLLGIMTQVEHEKNTREYLHNVKALFYQGVGRDETFWGKLAGYAGKFSTTDIDSMMLLPDSDLFMTAQRLYTKYLEEGFAEVDWIHQPNMFSTDLIDNYSKIEQAVLDDLKKMNPEIDAKTEEWRFKRAMSMAIGLSRGVLMTEAETAAWADPNVILDSKHKGEASYASYYTNDNAALNALNPLHHFMRWQAEGVIQGPLLFVPTSGFDPKLRRIWDHHELWDLADRYRDAWIEGRGSDHSGRRPDERLFLELLPNIGRSASLVSRGGWRYAGAAEGWMVREPSGKLDVLNSWKAVENIGFQSLFDFTNAHIDGKAKELAKDGQLNPLLKYIYEKYITEDSSPGLDNRFVSYQKGLEKTARLKIEELIRRKELSLEGGKRGDKIQELVNEEVVRVIVHRGLANIVRQRMPTKMVRIERSRQSEDGDRLWEKIRKDFAGNMSAEEGIKKMDSTMKLLMQVEAKLREEVSQKMKNHLSGFENDESNKTLHDLEGVDYRVTPDRIREILERQHVDAVKINEAVELFEKINTRLNMANGSGASHIDKFAEKMRFKDIKGEERPRDFPFAIGTEELDITFLAYRNAGPSVLARALGDTGRVEKDVTGNIMSYVSLLKKVSIDPKRDMSKMIEHLELAKRAIEDIHGKGYAENVAFHMAALTIAYFKKDTVAKNIFTKAFTAGKKNSLAAEFVPGPFKGVWEWEASDINQFMVELQRNTILSKVSQDLNAKPIELRKPITIPLPGGAKLRFGGKYKQPTASPYSTGKLGEEFGGSGKHRILEGLNKYLPLFLLFMMYSYIARAAKEAQGKQ